MRRRDVITAVAWLAAIRPFAALAQQKTPRLGVLWPVSESAELSAFRDGLRQLGYVEGQDVAIEYRFAEGNDALLPGLAADLVRQDVNVIVTWGVTAAKVAVQATKKIPIVNGSMSDPVRAKLVDSLARPGGNLTGLTSSTPELSAKRLELMIEIVPRLSRLAVLSTPNPTARLGLEETRTAAAVLRVSLLVQEVDDASDFDAAFDAMAEAEAEGLIVLADMLFAQHRDRLVGLTAQHRLPAISWAREFVEAGGLMSYAPSFRDQFRRAAVYVDKILKGANPAELPIERASKFELAMNLKTAEALGIEVPPTLLARADEVIE